MKVIVATKLTQGKRDNDFSFCEEGELVRFSWQCTYATTDDHCGCARSMSGFDCHQATTTMKVVDVKITLGEFFNRYALSFEESDRHSSSRITEAEALLALANRFSVGDILEYRDGQLRVRSTDPMLKLETICSFQDGGSSIVVAAKDNRYSDMRTTDALNQLLYSLSLSNETAEDLAYVKGQLNQIPRELFAKA